MQQDIRFVSSIKNKYRNDLQYFLELENTLFYPDGEGGQMGDRGSIGRCTVVRVTRNTAGAIVHEVESWEDQKEMEVECVIFGERRFDIAQQHTAQHLLSADLSNMYNINTRSFAMSEEYSTIDIDTLDWSWKKAEIIENMVFEQILSSLEIQILNVPKSDIHLYPLRKKVSEKIENLEEFRIVRIGNIDFSLCGGFHVNQTSQVGVLKILKFEKAKSELTRVYFVSGFRALKDFQKKTLLLQETTHSLSTSLDELNYRIQNILDEHQESKKINKKLSENLASALYNNYQSRKSQGGIQALVEILPSEEAAKGLSGKLLAESGTISFLLYERPKNSGYILSSTKDGLDAQEIFKRVKGFLEIKGGGTAQMVQGTVEGNITAIKEKCEQIFKSISPQGG